MKDFICCNAFLNMVLQFKNETHQPQELTEKGSSGIVRSIQKQIRPKNEAPNILT
jgi:hypothetical protein